MSGTSSSCECSNTHIMVNRDIGNVGSVNCSDSGHAFNPKYKIE